MRGGVGKQVKMPPPACPSARRYLNSSLTHADIWARSPQHKIPREAPNLRVTLSLPSSSSSLSLPSFSSLSRGSLGSFGNDNFPGSRSLQMGCDASRGCDVMTQAGVVTLRHTPYPRRSTRCASIRGHASRTLVRCADAKRDCHLQFAKFSLDTMSTPARKPLRCLQPLVILPSRAAVSALNATAACMCDSRGEAYERERGRAEAGIGNRQRPRTTVERDKAGLGIVGWRRGLLVPQGASCTC